MGSRPSPQHRRRRGTVLSADEWKAAYQALDAAARELHRLIEADEDNQEDQ